MYQPTTKSSNRSGYPKKHVIFVMSERKPSKSGSCSTHAWRRQWRWQSSCTSDYKKGPARRKTWSSHGWRTALNFVVCPSQLGGTLCRLAQPIQKSLFRWKTLVRNGWVRHLVHFYVVVLVKYDEHNIWNFMLGLFCHASYFDEVALRRSHSPVTSHSIYSVTKPNSTTVHFWGSLSRQHCPLWEPLSDLTSHDDPSCLCRESLRINFGTGFYVLVSGQVFVVTYTDFSSCPTTDLGFIGRFARVHMEFGRTTRERSDW